MSDCCIYEPQNYDPQAVDRFLRGETREICIELKCVEQEKSEDFAITDAVLQLDLIKCREPHMCDVPAHNTPYFDPSGLAKLSFLIPRRQSVRKITMRFVAVGPLTICWGALDCSL